MRARVIRAPAGSGKTRRYAELVANSTGIVEVYAPTNRLAEEWSDLILRFNPAKRVQVIRGRSATRQQRIRAGGRKKVISPGAVGQTVWLCQKHAVAEDVSRAGEPVYPNLCKRSQGPGTAPLKCQHYDYCDYIGQFYLADVYIYTHAHLALERGQLETWVPSAVVIDESFFQYMIEKIPVPISLLRHPSIPAAATSLCHDVANGLVGGSSLRNRFAVAVGHGGDFSAALKALKTSPVMSPSQTPAQQRASLQAAVSFAPVRKLLRQLAVETQVRQSLQSAIYDATAAAITLHYRKEITRFDRPDGTQPSITILDASASRAVIEPFFDIVSFETLDVPRQARVIQSSSTRCSTTSMVPSRNATAKSAADAAARLAEVTALIGRLAYNGRKVLVIGPTAVVGNPKAMKPPLIAVPAHCELAHFNALRGVDRWKDCDVVLLIGRNEPPVAEVENMARALFFSDPQPLALSGQWTSQVRGYRTTGAAMGVDTIIHADPRVQALVEQLRECESLQGVDRARLVYSPTAKLVVILSNIPLDIDVDELRTWDEIMSGTRLEQAWDSSGGVLPLNPPWLAANYASLWPTAAAAQKDVTRAIQNGHFSNINTISRMSFFNFDYRLPKQRQWSRCLSASDDAALVQTELTRILGQPVTVRPAPKRP